MTANGNFNGRRRCLHPTSLVSEINRVRLSNDFTAVTSLREHAILWTRADRATAGCLPIHRRTGFYHSESGMVIG